MPAPKGNNYAKGNSGGGAPEGNQNALGNSGGGPPEGNANGYRHGGYMTPEARREAFTAEDREQYAAHLSDFQESEPGVSEKLATELATATVMETRVAVELIDSGFTREAKTPDGEVYERFDVRKFDAHRAYSRDIRELLDEYRTEARKHRERKRQRQVELLTGLSPEGLADAEEREPPTENTPAAATAPSAGNATPASPPIVADGSGESPETPDDGTRSEAADDGKGEDEDESEDDTGVVMPDYTKMDMTR